MSVSDAFINELSILREAGTGLIVTRTREPYEASTAIRQYTVGANKKKAKANDRERLSYGQWDMLNGLVIESPTDMEFNERNAFNDKPEANKKQTVNVKGLSKVLQLMTGKLTGEEKKLAKGFDNGAPVGVYNFVWPQEAFDDSIPKTALLHIAEEFQYCASCVILVIPHSVAIPPELADFIVFLDYDPPGPTERDSIIKSVLSDFKINYLNTTAPIVKASAAMTGFELRSALSVSLKQMLIGSEPLNEDTVASRVLKRKTEIIKRTQILELLDPIDASQIGGMDHLKEYCYGVSKCFSEQALAYGVDKPKGVGLFGFPGTGKTQMARVIGSILGIPVVRLDISRILKKYVGESEGMVRTVFSIIVALAPCIVFIDEIDKFFSGSGEEAGGGTVSRRVLGMILAFMSDNKDPIFWALAANNVDNLPSELLRKQRLDENFYVGLPTPSERLAILRIHLAKRHQDPDRVSHMDAAVSATRGYVPAEIEAAVKEAVKDSFINGKKQITGESIAIQVNKMRPLSAAYPEQFVRMHEWANRVARPASIFEMEPEEAVEDEEELEATPGNIATLAASRRRKAKEPTK
jgi:SpoVK/Ycf46/Vps4 family AAA+-type ATPase